MLYVTVDTVSSVADIDECAEKRHDCSQFAECRNTVGGFQCACNAGFHGDGWDCLREYRASVTRTRTADLLGSNKGIYTVRFN